MAERIEKKRKRMSNGVEKPRKKSTPSASTTKLHFNCLSRDYRWQPVIAATSGIELPENLAFKTYNKRSASGEQLLLHSQDHAVLDYTARQQSDHTAERHLKHYIATYDPATQVVLIVEAPKVVVKTTVRGEDHQTHAIKATQKQNEGLSNKHLLGMEFGTKRSQKAIADILKNQAVNDKNANGELTEDQRAVLESISSSTADVPSQSQRQAAVDVGRPRPPANKETRNAKEVYEPDLVVGKDVLGMVRVKPWVEAVESGHSVELGVRYCAHRLESIVKANGGVIDIPKIKKLKTLRYIYLLVTYFKCLKPVRDGGRRVPNKDALDKLFEKNEVAFEPGLLDAIRHKFTDGTKQMSKWHVDLLMTHICALSLICDDSVSDIYDLMMDLGLKSTEMTAYFRECGVKLSSMTQQEKARTNFNSAELSMHRVARVTLPLSYPPPKSAKGRR